MRPEMIRVYDGEPVPYSEGQLRMDILPARAPAGELPDDFLAGFDVFRPALAPAPETDGLAEAVTGDLPELVDGVWTWTWRVEDKPLTLKEAKLIMADWINGLTAQIEAEYPRVVQKGWDEEEAMARAYRADPPTATQTQIDVLTRDATAKDRTPAEHADRIIDKADAFRAIAHATRALWLGTDKALDAAAPDQYPAVLRNAQAQAAPLAAQYGLTP